MEENKKPSMIKKLTFFITCIIWNIVFATFHTIRKILISFGIAFWIILIFIKILFIGHDVSDLTEKEKEWFDFKIFRYWNSETEMEYEEEMPTLGNVIFALKFTTYGIIGAAWRCVGYVLQWAILILSFPIIMYAILAEKTNIIDIENRYYNDKFWTWFAKSENE